MIKTIRNILYSLNFVWIADKTSALLLLIPQLINVVFYAGYALVIKFLIDGVMEQRPLVYLLSVAVGYSLMTWVSGLVSSTFYSRVSIRQQIRVEQKMTSLLLGKTIQIDAEQYDNPEFYDKLNKAAGNAETRAVAVYGELLSLLSNILNIALNITIMAVLSPMFIAVGIASIIFTYATQSALAKKQFQINEAIAPLSRRTEYFKNQLFKRETVTDVKQYMSLGRLLLRKFNDALTSKHALQNELANEQAKYSLLTNSLSLTTANLFPYCYLAIGGFYGFVSIADMTALLTTYTLFRQSMNSVTTALARVKEHAMYIDHFRTVMEYKPKIETSAGESVGEIETITFEDVSFKYPNSDDYALKDISFKVNRGEKTALVGVNGAGKTTLVKLLMRFYDPDAGRITLNGRDLREYDIQSLRSAITTVFQEFQSYSLPLDEFVACADGSELDDDRVRDALQRVGLLDKAEAATHGLHTEYTKFFDEDGLVFSGGQLQKLIIARMLYKGSSVLIMDEPSSALDPESEYEINRDIMEAARGKTILLISHRLSTTRDADNIVLIEGGAVQEQGTHSELLESGGRYAHLYTVQSSGYNQLIAERG